MKGSMHWRVANDNGVEAVHGVSDFLLYRSGIFSSFSSFFLPPKPTG